MKNRFVYACLLTMCAAVVVDSAAEPKQPLTLVPALNAERYLGRWYEIARFQHGFEKNLVGVTAEYTQRPDGRIGVINSGFKKNLDGKYTSVKAVAWIPNPARPGALKVRFFGLFTGDYLVFGLDEENYQWALVGDNSRKYLWFLARTPEIPAELFDKMRTLAEAQGYNLSGLVKIPQKLR